MRVVCLQLSAILVGSAVAWAQAPANLVENGDFEAGFKDGVAKGWETWTDPWGGREYHDEATEVHGGEHAQGWTSAGGSSSGIYQIVKGLTAGSPYRLTTWIQYQAPGVTWAECGFDPAGGSEQLAVHWRKLEGNGKTGRWLKYETDLVADGEAVSIWYKWGCRGSCAGMADDVSLVPIDTADIAWAGAAGKVWAASGPPLPGATVTVRPGRKSADSAGDGAFAFDELYPDTYTFTAEKPGYLPDSVTDVKLEDGQTAQVDLTMKPLNYIVGGDFEGVFTEGIGSCWTPWRTGNAQLRAMRSADVRQGGSACQQWESLAGQSGLRQVVVGLEEGATYILHAWVLPEGDAQIACGYDLTGGTELADATWTPEPAPTGRGWRHCTGAVKPEKGRLTIWLSWSSGRGWVDDVSLIRHDPDLGGS